MNPEYDAVKKLVQSQGYELDEGLKIEFDGDWKGSSVFRLTICVEDDDANRPIPVGEPLRYIVERGVARQLTIDESISYALSGYEDDEF